MLLIIRERQTGEFHVFRMSQNSKKGIRILDLSDNADMDKKLNRKELYRQAIDDLKRKGKWKVDFTYTDQTITQVFHDKLMDNFNKINIGKYFFEVDSKIFRNK